VASFIYHWEQSIRNRYIVQIVNDQQPVLLQSKPREKMFSATLVGFKPSVTPDKHPVFAAISWKPESRAA